MPPKKEAFYGGAYQRGGSVKVSKISSSKWESLYSLCHIGTPWIFMFIHMVSDRGSKQKINNKSDNGHPCQVPLLIGKVGDITKDSLTWDKGQ